MVNRDGSQTSHVLAFALQPRCALRPLLMSGDKSHAYEWALLIRYDEGMNPCEGGR